VTRENLDRKNALKEVFWF